jgi:hypothetical protein
MIYDPNLNDCKILIKHNGVEIGRAQSINVEMGYYGRNHALTSSPDLLRASISRARFNQQEIANLFGKDWCATDLLLTIEALRSDGTITTLYNTRITKMGYCYTTNDWLIAENIECNVGFWSVAPNPSLAQIISTSNDQFPGGLTTKSIQGFDIIPKEQPIPEPIETPQEAKPDSLFTAFAVAGTLLGAFVSKVFEMPKTNPSMRVIDPEAMSSQDQEDNQQEANIE